MKRQIEELIRAGNFTEAEKILRQVKVKNISRGDALTYANLANRLGEIRLSVKILAPVIMPEKPGAIPASNEERAQYASGMRKLGAISVAQEILLAIDFAQCPKAALELAFCYFNQWQYELAIPLLENYVRRLEPESYEKCVGQINLLAAYISERRYDEAARVIAELQPGIEARPLLYGNFLELSAQVEIGRGEWDKALELLTKASRLLKNAERSVQRLLIEKWVAVARSLKAGQTDPQLPLIRGEALSIKHWETVRDCDFYLARMSQDRVALERLYFSTPYRGFRGKILEALGANTSLPETFLWKQADICNQTIDLARGALSDGSAQLQVGQAVHRFLILLCTDLYRPVTLASAFSKLFPGEYFNPVSSPNRVYQVVRRFRSWVKENSLPLDLSETDGSYKLELTGGLAITIYQEPLPLEMKEIQFQWISRFLDFGQFTSRDLVEATGLSRSSVHRMLQWAESAGKIQSFGNTKGARYKLVA